jgi:hypothetical protein
MTTNTPKRTLEEIGDEEYRQMKPLERLRVLRDAWCRQTTQLAKSFFAGRMLEITIDMDEHPVGFDCACLCAACRSYGG